jgi:MGT family glycosyltransferase
MLGDRLLVPELPPLNRLRAGLGLPPLGKFDDQYLKADRFIAFTAEPYEYPRSDWPPSVRLVGPGTWEPPAEPPAWLSTETRPIVLVTASTVYQRDDKLIATALEALASENLTVVATTAALDPAAFDPPPNAHVERFLPHAPILARAACVVSHGGQGATQKALANGVPVCVVPFCRDQFDVARRVEVSGAGVRLHHKRLSPQRLRAAVNTAITKRPGAERIAQAFADAGGPSAAADAVEELLTTDASIDKRRNVAATPH